METFHEPLTISVVIPTKEESHNLSILNLTASFIVPVNYFNAASARFLIKRMKNSVCRGVNT